MMAPGMRAATNTARTDRTRWEWARRKRVQLWLFLALLGLGAALALLLGAHGRVVLSLLFPPAATIALFGVSRWLRLDDCPACGTRQRFGLSRCLGCGAALFDRRP